MCLRYWDQQMQSSLVQVNPLTISHCPMDAVRLSAHFTVQFLEMVV